jgi:hypothetical protein
MVATRNLGSKNENDILRSVTILTTHFLVVSPKDSKEGLLNAM